MGKPATVGMGQGKPWCIGCQSRKSCDPSRPECKDPGDSRCGTCGWAIGFELTPTGRFRKDTVAQCSAEVEWPPMPFFLVERMPQKGGWGTRPGCWSGRSVSPGDGKDCKCWKRKEDG
jgi:hypothetical protein